MNDVEIRVLRAYLCNGLSHRQIQEDILGLDAPERGGGFKAMQILHKFGVKGEHKSMLSGTEFDPLAFEGGDIQTYLSKNT